MTADEQIIYLYVEQRYSMTDVADSLGVSFRTVRASLVKHNVSRRPAGTIRPGKKNVVEHDGDILYMYAIEKRSMKECGKAIGRSENFVRKRLRCLGIKVRKQGSGQPRTAVTTDDERILELYEIGFLAPQIGKMLHWSDGFIRSRLKAHGIQLTRGHSIERIPHDEIVRVAFLYHNAKLDMPEIARREGKNVSWVRTRLYKTGLPLRGKSEVSRRNHEKKQALCA